MSFTPKKTNQLKKARRFIVALVVVGLVSIPFLLKDPSAVVQRTNDSERVTPPAALPEAALGETPFDEANLLKDNEFDNDDTWWNYTSSQNITARWGSTIHRGIFNHSSDPINQVLTQLDILNAFYDGTPVKDELKDLDSSTIHVSNGVGRRKILNVYFKDDITNGDEIHMTFT
ncbi:MAG: hypothetical protein ACTSU5_08080, partial [Promethearchaeota archaeon]